MIDRSSKNIRVLSIYDTLCAGNAVNKDEYAGVMVWILGRFSGTSTTSAHGSLSMLRAATYGRSSMTENAGALFSPAGSSP